MAHDLQNIIDKIIVVQKTVVTPTDEKEITTYYDEQPQSVLTFPSFVNVEEAIEDQVVWNSSGRRIDYLIAIHLVFSTADIKYSDRSMRKWVRPVLDAFGFKTTLDGATGVAKAMLGPAEFGLQTIGQTEYWAATFHLSVVVEEAFAWAV